MSVIREADALPTAELAGQALRHESAHLHVTGRAQYADDIPLPAGTLHAAFGLSRVAHARIRQLDLSPVLAAPGVVAVGLPSDIPGENNYGSVVHDDPIFTDTLVQFAGQPMFAVAAMLPLMLVLLRLGDLHADAG